MPGYPPEVLKHKSLYEIFFGIHLVKDQEKKALDLSIKNPNQCIKIHFESIINEYT